MQLENNEEISYTSLKAIPFIIIYVHVYQYVVRASEDALEIKGVLEASKIKKSPTGAFCIILNLHGTDTCLALYQLLVVSVICRS